MNVRFSFIKSTKYMSGNKLSSPARQRYFHKSQISSRPTPQKFAAKFLAGLKNLEQAETVEPVNMEDEAREWLESIRRLRDEFQSQSPSFNPNKALALTEGDEVNLADEARKSLLQQTFKPTELQLEEAAKANSTPIPSKSDSTLQFLTNIIMRHGRKAQAQKVMSRALYIVHLRTRLDPVEVLKNCLTAMSPCVKLRRYTDGGARSELIPVPLHERQRLRQAWVWLLDASVKRPSGDFAVRLAEEILSAHNGRSPGFAKKEALQKLAIANRAYMYLLRRR